MEFKDKTPKKNLAEQSFRLALSDFGRGLLLPKEKIENENLYFLYQEAGELKGAAGSLELENGNRSLKMLYSVNLNKRPKRLTLYFSTNPEDKSQTIKQTLELAESVATFGIRPYFACECGRSASVLYKPNGQRLFKCRICSRITYESARINKQSLNGLAYFVHKLTKLADKRENIKRMYHAGHLTRKGQALMAEYEAWQKEVEGRREALVNTHKMLASHDI
jgi:hypothetical protein